MMTQNDSKKKSSRRRYIIPAVIILSCILLGYVYKLLTSDTETDSENVLRFLRGVTATLPGETFVFKTEDLTYEDFSIITAIDFSRIYPVTHRPSSTGNSRTFTRQFNLSDMKLLEKCTNLRKLTLDNIDYPQNAIPMWFKILKKCGLISSNQKYLLGLSLLDKFSNLSELNMSNTSFEDINTITGIKNLEELNISNTKVSDLKPIRKFKQLKILNIKNCKNITDKEIEDLQAILPKLIIFR